MQVNHPKVSIIFPNYNGGKEPLDCLKSINALVYPKDKVEVIVVDNGSTDDSDVKIKRQFPKIKLLKNNKNLGFAKAINQGIKISTGKLILITNDDVTFEKNSLVIATDYLLGNKDVGIVGAKIYFKDNPKKICSSGFVMNKWTGSVHPAPKPNELKEPDWVQGCAILTTKSVLEKVDLLDPEYFLSFDDYDLCLRVKKIGRKVVYLPQFIVYHAESKTVDRNIPFKFYHWYRSKFRFLIKNMPVVNILSILSFQLFLASPYRLIKKDGRFVPLLKGLLWNIINFQKTLKVRTV